MMSLFKKLPDTDENIEKFRDITDDVIEVDFIPYACHWNESTIATKNGEVLQTIKITGHEQTIESASEVDVRAKIREVIKKCVDSNKYAIWIHTVRRKKSFKTDGEYKRDFSGYLNRFWNDKNDWEHKFVNEVYVTIVREGKEAKLVDPNIFARCLVLSLNNGYFEDHINKSCEALDALTKKMLSLLDGCGAKLLGVTKRNGRYYSEVCEFLGKLATLRDIEVPVNDKDISNIISDYDVTFGYNAMEVRTRADGKRRFGAILTVKEYRDLEADALNLITHIPAELIISQSFEFIPAKFAMQEYERQKEILEISQASSLYEKTGLKAIISDNTGGKTDFGRSQINLFLLADSVRLMEAAVANAAKAFSALGMATIREDIKIEECYWAQMPGNFEFIRRMNPISTARIGGFVNLSALPKGNEGGNRWGPAVTTLYTVAQTPYYFNFHQGNSGHTLLIGDDNAGKTVLLNFLLSEARKFDGKVFFFDTGRRAEIFLRSIGGSYYNPYPGADPRPYAQLSLNPFELTDSQETRGFLHTWLMSLAGAATPELSAICKKVVPQVMMLPKEERSIKRCVDFIREQNADMAKSFLPWTEGPFANIFSQKQSLTFDNNVCGFEMGDVLAHKETIAPVMLYLLQCLRGALDGKPAIIVMSEAYEMLGSPALAPHLAMLLDFFTAKNAIALLAASSGTQASQSSIHKTLMGKIATQIYLPDDNADVVYEKTFGLTDTEVSYLSLMNREERHFLMKNAKEAVLLGLDISGMRDILAVLEATDTNLAKMEDVITKQGRAHQKWMPEFLKII